MKSVIKGIEEGKQEEVTFPVLMEYIDVGDGKFVVMFTSNTEGVVVYSEHTNRFVGERNDDWFCYNDTRIWKKFTGVVELSN